jgi:hypothetical protein
MYKITNKWIDKSRAFGHAAGLWCPNMTKKYKVVSFFFEGKEFQLATYPT